MTSVHEMDFPRMLEIGNLSQADSFSYLGHGSGRGDITSVSDSVTLACQWIFSAVMCLGIAVFGIVTNIIIIVCFIMEGFKHPVNISFVGLAVSDIGCLTTLFWTNLCYTPAFVEADLPFDSMEVQYLTSGMPHTAFTRVTSWITALITLERCLCITSPLKVKTIITHRRVTIIMMCIYIVNISSASPTFVVTRLGFKFYPSRNRTLIGLLYSENRELVESVCYGINNVLIPFTSFVVVSISTLTLVIQLKRKTKWRTKSTVSSQADNVSSRNQKMAKMVLIISFLFIACFVPLGIFFIVMSLEPGLSIGGKYNNYFTIFGSMSMMLESINSSGNIFIYYIMSIKFREVFHNLFKRKK